MRQLFTLVSMLLLMPCVPVAAIELIAHLRYGAPAFARRDGMRLFIGQNVPYRWPVAPWEAWESDGPLGFKAGTFWIGGVVANEGQFLTRYRYVVMPYWWCGVILLIAGAGAVSVLRSRSAKRSAGDLPW